MADRLGRSEEEVADWEATGYRQATLEELGRVAEAVGLRLRANYEFGVEPQQRTVRLATAVEQEVLTR